ncbi:MAG: lipopolysaccharide biosynthesis protein [Defluviicoccus sp.]
MIKSRATETGSLRERTLRGVAVTASRGVFTAVLRILTVAILARILVPEDFGLVAAVATLQQIASLFVLRGLGDVIVQKAEVTANDTGTAMTLLVLSGTLCYAAFWFAADWIEEFLALPGAAVTLRVISLAIPIEALAQVYISDARRRLRFERIALIEAAASVFGYTMLSIGLALAGAGAWALVGGVIGVSVIRLIGFAWDTFRDCRPRFSLQSARRMFSFTALVTIWTVAGHIFYNIDRLILARLMGAEAVGYLTNARNFVTMFTEFYAHPVNQVLFPVLSRLQNDRERLLEGYRRAAAFSALLGMPSALVVCLIAEPLVAVLLGSQWGPAVPVVQVMGLSIFTTICAIPSVVFLRGMGQVSEVVALTIAQAVILIIGLFLVYPYGLQAVAGLSVANQFIGEYLGTLILGRKLKAPIRQMLAPLRTATLVTLLLAAIWLALQAADVSTSTYLGAGVFVFLGGAAFLALFFLAPKRFLGRDLQWLHALVIQEGGKLVNMVHRRPPLAVL